MEILDKLSEKQKKLIDILKKHQGEPLSLRDLRDLLEVNSHNTVQHHLDQLERKGFLRRNPTNPQDYQILADAPDKKITYINVYGLAQCGPNGSVLDGSPIDRIAVQSRLLGFPSSEAFLVKAKGKSMLPKIREGDYILAQITSDIKNGDIVVCTNQGEALVKKYNIMNNQIILSSINPEFEPFFADIDDFRVEGKVKALFSYFV